MNWLLLILGLAVVLAATVDLMSSTLGIEGGFLGRRITRFLWRVAVRFEEWVGGGAKLLRPWGIILNVLPLLMWIALIILGWTLIFAAWAPAVIDQSTSMPADFLGRLQFTVSTLSGLGRGLFKAGSPDYWKIITILASIGGTFVISFAISFLIPVIQAATDKRTVAHRISLLGSSPLEILNTYCEQEDAQQLHGQLANLLDSLIDVYEKHRTYPTLHFLFSHHRSDNMALNLVVLDETITLLKSAFPTLYGPPPLTFDPVREILTKVLDDLDAVYAEKGDDQDFSQLVNEEQIAACIDCEVDTQSYREYAASDELKKRRKKLSTLLRNNGWNWRDVYQLNDDDEESIEKQAS